MYFEFILCFFGHSGIGDCRIGGGRVNSSRISGAGRICSIGIGGGGIACGGGQQQPRNQRRRDRLRRAQRRLDLEGKFGGRMGDGSCRKSLGKLGGTVIKQIKFAGPLADGVAENEDS